MKKFTKKHWKKILIGLVVLFFIQKIYGTFFKKQIEIKETNKNLVELFSIGGQKTGMLEAFCSVEASADAAVTPESGGKVTSVFVEEGQIVEKGQKLFALSNIQQRVSVQNAKVSVKSAELALADLLKKNDSGSGSSLLNQTVSQQETLVENARNAYLNNDLAAHPEDFDETSAAPIISGNYTCNAEGIYTLDVYSSASDSGASIRLSGLEAMRNTVSTDYSVPLGDCGLEIVFPENFKKNKIWTISIPNTRSSSHFAAKKSYEATVSGKDITLNNTQASPEQISRAQAQVTQAKLQLQSTYETLSKTIIKAPVAGTLSDFDISSGDFVTAFSETGRVKSIGDLELVSYINADEKKYIVSNAKALFNDIETTVLTVSPTLNSNKKVKVVLDVPENSNLTEGTQMTCSIDRFFADLNSLDIDGTIIPLSSLSIIGQDAYVFEVLENKAYKKLVETGSLLGKDIIVYGVTDGDIIKDARGIRDEQEIFLK